jgi:hypothetical protein
MLIVGEIKTKTSFQVIGDGWNVAAAYGVADSPLSTSKNKVPGKWHVKCTLAEHGS